MFLGKWMGGEGHPVEENGVSQKNKGDIRRERMTEFPVGLKRPASI